MTMFCVWTSLLSKDRMMAFTTKYACFGSYNHHTVTNISKEFLLKNIIMGQNWRRHIVG